MMAATTLFEKHAHIKTKVFKFAHRWTIDRFADYDYYYCAFPPNSDFQSPTNPKLGFRLDLLPKVRSGNADFVNFTLRITNMPKNRVNLQANLSILDSKIAKCFTSEAKFVSENFYSWNNFINRDYLLKRENGLVPDNKLTLLCEILYDDDIEEPEIVSGQIQLENYAQVRIINDFCALFKSGKLSDVSLTVGKKEFCVHKAILSLRSPIFASMFEYKSDTLPIAITDVDSPEVFEELLRYIYTGKVQQLDQHTISLFAAAKKYGLIHLEIICEESMCANISTDILTELLQLASKYDAKKLKAKIVEYIQNYANCIFETENLKSMLKTQPDLFYEVFCDLMETFDS